MGSDFKHKMRVEHVCSINSMRFRYVHKDSDVTQEFRCVYLYQNKVHRETARLKYIVVVVEDMNKNTTATKRWKGGGICNAKKRMVYT